MAAGAASSAQNQARGTRLLGLMRKGITAIRNLAVLKWCRERRIPIAWNQLCAIPGERTEDYDEQIALMKQIPHFPPPELANPITIDRHSPCFERYREFGWSEIEPLPEYRQHHPHLDHAALRDIAYHFQGVGEVRTDGYFERFDAAVRQWQQRNVQGEGLFWNPVQGVVRNEATSAYRIQTAGVVGSVLSCTHEVVPITRVLEQVGCARSVLDQMVEHGLLFIEGKQVLNLMARTQPPDR